MPAFVHLSLSRQFLLASFVILFGGMLVIGAWVARQIEQTIVSNAGTTAALYVGSFIAPRLQRLATVDDLEPREWAALGSLITETALGRSIVSLKVWGPDGRVLYSTDQALTGRTFPVRPPLAQAFAGAVHAEISDLGASEHEHERMHWSRLIEIYAPVRVAGSDRVVAVSEFYGRTDELEGEVRAVQQRSWVMFGAATILIYLLLGGLVGRASNTIIAQQNELRERVAQLTGLLTQNRELHDRVRRAAARTTALNERYLRRIAADLHDGPGQDLGLAMLRIGALAEACERCTVGIGNEDRIREDFRTIQTAIDSALTEVRVISSGLRLPQLDTLSPVAVAERAVSDYRRKSGRAVALNIGNLPERAPLPVKIALYRLLQESLANGLRHGGGVEQRVTITGVGQQLMVEVADGGPGFDPNAVASGDRLGLEGMRERLEILGGTFEIVSTPARGTTVKACLPLDVSVLGDG